MLGALGWRGELGVLAALVVVAFPLHNFAVPKDNANEAPAENAQPGGKSTVGLPLIMLSAAWMLFFAAFASVPTFAPQWIGGGQAALTRVTLIMWVSLIFSPLLGAAIDRVGRPTAWVFSGLVLLTLTLGLMATESVGAGVAMVLVGLCAAAVPTATYALPAQIVPPARVGFAFGLITAFSNLGTVWGPAAAGAILDASGDWFLVWIVLAALAGLGATAAALIRPKTA